MTGTESIDHVAIPVRDLDKAEAFYVGCLGLPLKTRRKNLDGSPRQTYVLAGENIIGLHLPGIQADPSPTGAPRIGIAVSKERFRAVLKELENHGHPFQELENNDQGFPISRAATFLDSDGNWVEVCVWRKPPEAEFLSHIVVETAVSDKASAFYREVLGMEPIGKWEGVSFARVRSGQLFGLKSVAHLSERSRKHGRGCHIAFNVPHSDFEEMVRLIPQFSGMDQGDPRAEDGLRPEGEKSTYLADPDKNRLQITAAAASSDGMLSDEEKWRRIVENREKQGRGISRWDRGEGKLKKD